MASDNEQEDLRDADFSRLEEEEVKAGEGLGGEDLAAAAGVGQQNNQAELEEMRGKYLRALADYENYKKRALKERSDILKYQGEKALFDFLDIADNIELALEHSEADPQQLKEGIQLIHKLLMNTFEKWEVRPVSGIGKPFDPNQQSAISQVPSDEVEPGTVISELKKSYFFKDKLLREGEVVVAVRPEVVEGSSEEENPEG